MALGGEVGEVCRNRTTVRRASFASELCTRGQWNATKMGIALVRGTDRRRCLAFSVELKIPGECVQPVLRQVPAVLHK